MSFSLKKYLKVGVGVKDVGVGRNALVLSTQKHKAQLIIDVCVLSSPMANNEEAQEITYINLTRIYQMINHDHHHHHANGPKKEKW